MKRTSILLLILSFTISPSPSKGRGLLDLIDQNLTALQKPAIESPIPDEVLVLLPYIGFIERQGFHSTLELSGLLFLNIAERTVFIKENDPLDRERGLFVERVFSPSGTSDSNTYFGRGWISSIDPYEVNIKEGKMVVLKRNGKEEQFIFKDEKEVISKGAIDSIIQKKIEYDRGLNSQRGDFYYDILRRKLLNDPLLYRIFSNKFHIINEGRRIQIYKSKMGVDRLSYDGKGMELIRGDGKTTYLDLSGIVKGFSLPSGERVTLSYKDNRPSVIGIEGGDHFFIVFDGDKIKGINKGEIGLIEYSYEGDLLTDCSIEGNPSSRYTYSDSGEISRIKKGGMDLEVDYRKGKVESIMVNGRRFVVREESKGGTRRVYITDGEDVVFSISSDKDGVSMKDSLNRDFFISANEMITGDGKKYTLISTNEGRPRIFSSEDDRIEFEYRNDRRLESILSNGRVIRRFEYDEKGEIKGFSTPSGRWVIGKKGEDIELLLSKDGRRAAIEVKWGKGGSPALIRIIDTGETFGSKNLPNKGKAKLFTQGREVTFYVDHRGRKVIESKRKGQRIGEVVIDGNSIAISSPSNNFLILKDEFDRMVRLESPAGKIELKYGADSSLDSMELFGRRIRFSKGEEGLLSIEDDDRSGYIIQFDKSKRLRTLTDGKDVILSTRFDRNRLSSLILHGSRDMGFYRDGDGRMRIIPSGGEDILISTRSDGKVISLDPEEGNSLKIELDADLLKGIKRADERLFEAEFDLFGRPERVDLKENGATFHFQRSGSKDRMTLSSDDDTRLDISSGKIEGRFRGKKILLEKREGIFSSISIDNQNYRLIRDEAGRLRGMVESDSLTGLCIYDGDEGILISTHLSPHYLVKEAGGVSLFFFKGDGSIQRIYSDGGTVKIGLSSRRGELELVRKRGLVTTARWYGGNQTKVWDIRRDGYGRVQTISGNGEELILKRDYFGILRSFILNGVEKDIRELTGAGGEMLPPPSDINDLPPLLSPWLHPLFDLVKSDRHHFSLVEHLLDYLTVVDILSLCRHIMSEEKESSSIIKGLRDIQSPEIFDSFLSIPFSEDEIYPSPIFDKSRRMGEEFPSPPFPFEYPDYSTSILDPELLNLNVLFEKMEAIIEGDISLFIDIPEITRLRIPGLLLRRRELDSVFFTLSSIIGFDESYKRDLKEGWKGVLHSFLSSENLIPLALSTINQSGILDRFSSLIDLIDLLNKIDRFPPIKSQPMKYIPSSQDQLLGTNLSRWESQKRAGPDVERWMLRVSCPNKHLNGEKVVQIFDRVAKLRKKRKTLELFSCTEGLILNKRKPFSSDCPFTHTRLADGEEGLPLPLSILILPIEEQWKGVIPDSLRNLCIEKGLFLVPDPNWKGWSRFFDSGEKSK